MGVHHEVDWLPDIAFGAGDQKTHFVPKHGFYAVHHWGEGSPRENPVLVLDDAAVFEGDSSGDAGRKEGPVYEALPGRITAVPTGRVFVRFAKSVSANSREFSIRNAGYEIVQQPAWAPHTAWVEAITGDVIESLRNMDRLWQINEVENVEPQMLMPAATRA
jgi:hypothetical protein